MTECYNMEFPEVFNFDSDKLYADYMILRNEFPDAKSFMTMTVDEESSTVIENLHDYSYLRRKWENRDNLEESFDVWAHKRYSMDHWHSHIKGTYTEAMMHVINGTLNTVGKRVSGMVYHDMKPGYAYPMHTDILRYNMHIPVRTNHKCVFVTETELDNDEYVVKIMPEEGRVYRFISNINHTAVNGSADRRIHIVFNVVDQDYTVDYVGTDLKL